MNPPAYIAEANADWNERRERIYRWMTDNGLPSYADLYKGAVLILHSKPPGYVRFVSHAARDLMNGMAAAKKELKRPQTQYVDIVNDLTEAWDTHRLPRSAETFGEKDKPVDDPPDLSVPNEVVKHIQLLLYEHEQGRKRSEDKPFLFFEAFLPNAAPRDSIPEAYPRMWIALKKWFEARTHEGGKGPQQEVLEQINTKLSDLEVIFATVADRYLNTISALDEILDQANK